MGQSLCKRNKTPHNSKKKKKKRAFAHGLVHTPFQLSSVETKPQNSSGDEEWLIFIAGILRGLTGACRRVQQQVTGRSNCWRGIPGPAAGVGWLGELRDLSWIYYPRIRLLGVKAPETSQLSKENNKQCERSEKGGGEAGKLKQGQEPWRGRVRRGVVAECGWGCCWLTLLG